MKKISFLMAGALCLMSCNNETNITDPETDSDEGRITLELADATVMTYSTADEEECKINYLWVLEFNGEALVNDTLITGDQILGNGAATQLLPQLPFKPENGHRIVLIANSDAMTFPHPNRSSIQYSNINTYFPLYMGYYGIWYAVLPMYGEIASWPGGYSCEMTRAVAKIQVQLGENYSDVTGTFNAENVIWGMNYLGNGGYIQPRLPLQGIPIIAPGGGGGNGMSTFLPLLQNYDPDLLQFRSLYIQEYPSSTTTGISGDPSVPENVFARHRQCILLQNNVAGWYRLDFYDPVTRKFIDTKRNHHYIFTIHRVNSEGYGDLYQALNNPGSNIEYTIEIRDGARHITSNGQYAVVSSVDTAYVAAPATAVTVCTARYQLPAEMSALGLWENTPNTITFTDVVPDNPSSITLVSPPPTPYFTDPYFASQLTATSVPIVVTTTAAFQSARIKMQVGNISHYVVLKKK
ncbi:MAG: hypothetical protein LBT42_00175 [Tannerella sp.]|jgi:hypothetical protein|nr:hypothetical protein [Tannerella sp.]